MNNSSKEVLKINKLNAIYPNSSNYALKGLDLNMNRGDRLALVGSSGCGKSTVAKAVMQLLPKGCFCDGEIVLNGKNYFTAHYKLKSKDENTPKDKKLDFDIWLDKKNNLILKVTYKRMGDWEYRLKSFN